MFAGIKQKEGVLTGKMEVLCRGREPIAEARLSGEGKCGDISGTVSFFYTPLGILIAASVWGLERGAYTMSITEGSGKTKELKTLYNKDGYAWCADVTGKISALELTKSRINLCKLGISGQSIATGSVKKCAY